MDLIKRFQIFVNNPWRIFYNLNKRKISHIIPDKIMLQLLYRAKMGKKLNLKNPVTFNEKLQWLKLYDHNPEYIKFVDKYEVRNYIAEKIGEEYLVPLLGVWDNVNDIDFDLLPNQFVLKCTHDSGSVIICKDKARFDVQKAKGKLQKAMETNFYWLYREWPYKNVKPRVVAEQYLEDNESEELSDYKIMCFNGKQKCTFTCTNRFSGTGLNVTFFDTEWNRLPFERHYKADLKVIKKPKSYAEMVELAEKLSENIPFSRIDFYKTNNKIYFGEITLYPGSGFEEFEPVNWDTTLGSWIKLPDDHV
ncbi:MAG: ATP-grasp fold amidoligase family protein [Frisingicoccus sp.]|uniref:ATP-grasp fold amidoligase family protein n=1 Tax=Frisingicoccus sp. TaxID=1918627 RepID=UPI00261E40B8|nr:ATP-grasp fold amidoligase family protein [Frisingicoccus sp.]MDD6232080.1 ATP-grasp fold amidoligase family protein [Frisingicoccus sp.]